MYIFILVEALHNKTKVGQLRRSSQKFFGVLSPLLRTLILGSELFLRRNMFCISYFSFQRRNTITKRKQWGH